MFLLASPLKLLSFWLTSSRHLSQLVNVNQKPTSCWVICQVFFKSTWNRNCHHLFIFIFFAIVMYKLLFEWDIFLDSTWFWECIENWVLDCCCLLINAPSCGWFLESRNYCPGLVNMSSKNRRDVVARGMEKFYWFWLKIMKAYDFFLNDVHG